MLGKLRHSHPAAVSAVDTAAGTVVDAVSRVPLPKQAVLVNFRLGILLKSMQFVAGVFVIRSLLYTRTNSVDFFPSSMETTFWMERGVASDLVAPAHCADLGAYTHKYSHAWTYQPTSCEDFEDGDFYKTESEAYFSTYVSDTVKVKSRGERECNETASMCESEGGNFVASTSPSAPCVCSFAQEYYVKDQEKNRLIFQHAYVVQDTPDGTSFQRGHTGAAYYTTDKKPDEKLSGKMLTRILKPDGTPCKVGGTSEFLSGIGGSEIGGTLEEWLACADFSLDDQSEKTRSNLPGETTAPHLRTTGVNIAVELRYQNTHKLIDKDVVTICDAFVQVTPVWNSRQFSDHTKMELSGGRGGPGTTQYRWRYSYGVSFSFKRGGSFYFFNWNRLVTTIVNAIVLFGIPVQIIGFIALYGIGRVSEVYAGVVRQNFNIFDQFHGLAARMMLASVGFRTLTKQLDTAIDDMKSMRYDDIEQRMLEAFAYDMKDNTATGKKAALRREEVQKLAGVVLAGLGSLDATDDEVSFYDFVQASSSSEFLCSKTMSVFFNEDHKPHALARFFDPTKSQIQNIKKKVTSAATFRISSKSQSPTQRSVIDEPEYDERRDPGKDQKKGKKEKMQKCMRTSLCMEDAIVVAEEAKADKKKKNKMSASYGKTSPHIDYANTLRDLIDSESDEPDSAAGVPEGGDATRRRGAFVIMEQEASPREQASARPPEGCEPSRKEQPKTPPRNQPIELPSEEASPREQACARPPEGCEPSRKEQPKAPPRNQPIELPPEEAPPRDQASARPPKEIAPPQRELPKATPRGRALRAHKGWRPAEPPPE